MDHIVYLDYKAKELANLSLGLKSMIIRGAMGRKLPYGRIENGDTLYFMENNGDGMVKAKAIVQQVFNSGKLSKEESYGLVDSFNDKLMLDSGLKKRFRGKRYLVLITIRDFEQLEPFKIDRTEFGNMDDWLPVEDIEKYTTSLDL
jgi:hypothetical protein